MSKTELMSGPARVEAVAASERHEAAVAEAEATAGRARQAKAKLKAAKKVAKKAAKEARKARRALEAARKDLAKAEKAAAKEAKATAPAGRKVESKPARPAKGNSKRGRPVVVPVKPRTRKKAVRPPVEADSSPVEAFSLGESDMT